MFRRLLFVLLAALVSCAAEAGVGKAVKAAAEEVAGLNYVVAISSSGGSVATQFLANRDLFEIVHGLYATMGVDLRADDEFFGQFGNLGVGGGLSYKAYKNLVVQVGYSHDVAGTEGPKTNRAYFGVGFTRK